MSKLEDIIIRSCLILLMVTSIVLAVLVLIAMPSVGKSSTTCVEVRCAEWDFPDGRP